MSQHDLTIANQGFPAFRADLNSALQALGSCQSGTSAPSPTFANQLWYDTTNNILKIRNEDNDAWISLFTLDQTADTLASVSGLVIGTNVQAYDPDLTNWAGKTAPTGDAVGTSDSQTLTNKIINASQLVDASITQAKLGLNVVGNGPSFSAYLSSSSQSITSGVETVAILNNEEWDTAGCFNNTGSTVTLNGLSVPAYAFCPNVAGYYQISLNLRYASSGNFTAAVAYIRKNAGQLYRWNEYTSGSYVPGQSVSGSMLVYLNGTGDYIQSSAQITGTSPTFENAGSPYTSRMQAALVRSA